MNVLKKCQCDTPLCAKCLGGNCHDDNCDIHTLQNKIRTRERIIREQKLTDDKLLIYRNEIDRLKSLLNKI